MANFDLIQQQFLEVVDKQLKADNPRETQETLVRLKDLGYSDLEARTLIAQCVATEMYAVMQSNEPYNVQRYIAMLYKLPESPKIEVNE